jgi:hypothetical protein
MSNGTIGRALRNKKRKDTTLKFYNIMAVPVLLYDSENFAMNREE